jgi:hypothetical protein
MLEALGLANYQHMPEMNLLRMRRRGHRFVTARLSLGTAAVEQNRQTNEGERNSKTNSGFSQGCSFEAQKVRFAHDGLFT